MTVFGKILAFFVLILSVATGALLVFVFSTRADWKAAYEAEKNKAIAAEAALKSERASHEADLKSKDAAIKDSTDTIAALQQNIKAAIADRQEAIAALQKVQTIVNSGTNKDAAVIAELESIKKERLEQAKTINDLQVVIVKLQNEKVDQEKLRIQAQNDYNILKQKNAQLIASYNEVVNKMREMESNGALIVGGAGKSNSVTDATNKSAPPGVQGKVTAIGQEGTNLAQISVGSDSGISVGNVLTVYSGSTYLGDLTVTVAESKIAVGKFAPAKRNFKIEVGNSVITSFSTAN
jgi:hypothetical protein